jgi:hypothetical protein
LTTTTTWPDTGRRRCVSRPGELEEDELEKSGFGVETADGDNDLFEEDLSASKT